MCAECGRRSDEQAEGWQAHLGKGGEHRELEAQTFCPECADREFGADRQFGGPAQTDDDD